MPNPFSLFQRAAAGLNLSPMERASLKFIKAAGYAFLIGVMGVITPMVASGHFTGISASTLQAVLGGGLVAAAIATEKWFSAQGDAKSAPPSSAA